MCYGAKTQYDNKPYENSHIAFVSTVYRTLNMCVSNLFNGDYDLVETYKELYNDTKIDNVMKKFSCVSKNIINAIKEDAPIENSLFDECFNNMYEEAKKDSLEEKFIYKSLKFVDELENLENPSLKKCNCTL